MSLQAVDHQVGVHSSLTKQEPPTKISVASKCPVWGYKWIPEAKMPNGRLARHIQTISVFVAEMDAQAKKERKVVSELSFTLQSGAAILESRTLEGRAHRHEIETLVSKNLLEHPDSITYKLKRESAMEALAAYIQRW